MRLVCLKNTTNGFWCGVCESTADPLEVILLTHQGPAASESPLNNVLYENVCMAVKWVGKCFCGSCRFQGRCVLLTGQLSMLLCYAKGKGDSKEFKVVSTRRKERRISKKKRKMLFQNVCKFDIFHRVEKFAKNLIGNIQKKKCFLDCWSKLPSQWNKQLFACIEKFKSQSTILGPHSRCLALDN